MIQVDMGMSKGSSSRVDVIGGRGKTVSLFLTVALGRLQFWSKWIKSKEIRFRALIRARRLPDFLFEIELN